jgi:hypothetical protein
MNECSVNTSSGDRPATGSRRFGCSGCYNFRGQRQVCFRVLNSFNDANGHDTAAVEPGGNIG